MLRDCGCESHTEFPLPGTKLRPADVFTPAFPVESAMAIDVGVVHPLLLSHTATATVSAGAAAQKREVAKVKLYGEECGRRSWGFTAFMGESTGAWGQAAQRCVRALARAKSLRMGEAPQEVVHAVWDSVCRAVASSIAHQLVRARMNCGALGKLAAPARGSSSRPRTPSQGVQSVGEASAAGLPEGFDPRADDFSLACALCQ